MDSFSFASLPHIIILMMCCYLQPPEIKAFIDKVIQSPLQDIAIPLSGFRWEFSKVNTSFSLSANFSSFSSLVWDCFNLFYPFNFRGIFITGDHCFCILILISRLTCLVGTTSFYQMISQGMIVHFRRMLFSTFYEWCK